MQHETQTNQSPTCPGLAVILAGAGVLVLLSGCSGDEIQVYSVPKETPIQLAWADPPQDVHLHWELPRGWEELGADGLRAASFIVRDGTGETAEVRIVPLRGEANVPQSVNIWRGELGLDEAESDELVRAAEPVRIGDQTGALYDLTGTDDRRLIGAVLQTLGTTWFFRMTGPEAVVAAQKPLFKEFLQTMEFHAGEDHADHAAHASAPSSPRPSAVAAGASAPSGTPALPDWSLPRHWKTAPLTPMLLARFMVEGDAGQTAEVTVSAFPGDVGGLLANVNRWRGQIGLGPIERSELGGLTSPIELQGEYVTLVDMTNDQPGPTGHAQRVLVVLVPREGRTWFYKMQGNPPLVAREKEEFIEFVRSVRYAPVS